jgi:hypothetical protein
MVLGKRNRGQRKVGNNTYAYILLDGSVAIELHGTKVVVIHPDDSVTLNSGGYHTSTTKKRINQYSPVKVYQKNYEWFLSDGTPFEDHMIVTGAAGQSNDGPCFAMAFLSRCVVFLLTCLPVSSFGGVFTDVVYEMFPASPASQRFDYSPSANGGRGLWVTLTPDEVLFSAGTMTPITYNLAFPYSWYRASEDDIFDAGAVERMTPFVSNWGILTPIQVPLEVPFFLASWGGTKYPSDNKPTPGDTYTWGKFLVTYDGTGLDMRVISSVMAYDGIVVGRNIAVPEPSTCIMALAGLACGGCSMWRRRLLVRLNN